MTCSPIHTVIFVCAKFERKKKYLNENKSSWIVLLTCTFAIFLLTILNKNLNEDLNILFVEDNI